MWVAKQVKLNLVINYNQTKFKIYIDICLLVVLINTFSCHFCITTQTLKNNVLKINLKTQGKITTYCLQQLMQFKFTTQPFKKLI